MSLRLQVQHITGYTYDTEVVSSYNEARLLPLTSALQTTLVSTIEATPDITQQRYWDYWGTQVTAFDVHVPHDELSVTCTSIVDTADAREPGDIGWEDIEASSDNHVELMQASARTAPDDELKSLARGVTGSPLEVVLGLAGLVHDRVEYVPGSTGVQHTAAEVWQQKKGVCQDIAHVTLALLRAAGVPARYVSGYLHPGAEPVLGETVKGESHAWIEAWLGEWWGFDPTNGVPAGERHVLVARGRDYSDVPPLKGVYAGGGSQHLRVSVTVTRLG
jgi:transglutaminase-like putative cysteine protease